MKTLFCPNLRAGMRWFLAIGLLASTLWLGAAPAAAETAAVVSWSVEPAQSGILIRWTTNSEVDSLGFNLYRGLTHDLAQAAKLTRRTIPSQGSGSATGASYSYLDRTARPGKTYYYWLEHTTSENPAGGSFMMAVYDLGAGRWAKPQALRVSPNAGGKRHNLAQRFTATFQDPDTDLARVYLLIGDAPALTGGMALRYEVSSGLLSLFDASQGGWQPGIPAKAAGSLNSSWGTLFAQSSNVQWAAQSKTLRVAWSVSFGPQFVGTHRLYIMAEDAAGNTTGWQLAGFWQVR